MNATDRQESEAVVLCVATMPAGHAHTRATPM